MTQLDPASSSPNIPRFSRNDLVYLAGLLLLFAGVAATFSWGVALLVLGAVITGVNIATSFFVTWLSVRKES